MKIKPAALITIGLIFIAVIAGYIVFSSLKKDPIKVGILHSLTGTMAASEKPVVDSVLLAIDEINANGGILGRKIEATVIDSKSDLDSAKAGIEKLINEEKVSAIFGCWTSACRKTVKPLLEKYDHLMIYSVQYEGLEQSPNIIYLGQAPNQQIIPGLTWAINKIGKKVFLVGSDYVFPRTANEIIKDMIPTLGGEVVGEAYVPLGGKDFTAIVAQINQVKPDVIINTINGDSNIAFFDALRKAAISPQDIPTFSFSISEQELKGLDLDKMAGDYATWGYFQSIDNQKNQAFIKRYKNKYGDDSLIGDPQQIAYTGIYLWKKAIESANSTDTQKVRKKLKKQMLEAPEGLVYIDFDTQHAWRKVRVGKILENGQFEIVWQSDKPIKPQPYPSTRTIKEWHNFLQTLYKGWNNSWSAPTDSKASK